MAPKSNAATPTATSVEKPANSGLSVQLSTVSKEKISGGRSRKVRPTATARYGDCERLHIGIRYILLGAAMANPKLREELVKIPETAFAPRNELNQELDRTTAILLSILKRGSGAMQEWFLAHGYEVPAGGLLAGLTEIVAAEADKTDRLRKNREERQKILSI